MEREYVVDGNHSVAWIVAFRQCKPDAESKRIKVGFAEKDLWQDISMTVERSRLFH